MKNIFLGMGLIFLQLSQVFVVVLSHKQEVVGQWEQKYQPTNKKHHAVAQIFCDKLRENILSEESEQLKQ